MIMMVDGADGSFVFVVLLSYCLALEVSVSLAAFSFCERYLSEQGTAPPVAPSYRWVRI
jgi:hypothetical protein